LSDGDYRAPFESEMADVIEGEMDESFIFGDVAQGDFVLVKLAGKKEHFSLHS
jgi:hypothetical protein